ncbi:MAG: DUF4097 family beta strand repeat-containing protein, partial [Longimicrobiales bacterium]
MITAILAGALAIGLPQQQTDTTFAVRAGGELEVDVLNGSVSIGTWDRPAMRVRATHRRTTVVELEHRGSNVSIDTEHRDSPEPVAFEITVPRRYNVSVEGVNLRITIADLQGSASLENVQGPIVVRGVSGPVEIESVSGSVSIENVRGDISVSTVNDAIRISGGRGNIAAETVNGSIVMRGVDAAMAEASTVNGLVEYDGAVRDGGRYFLGTHNGRITMAIPERANARIAIETENGSVESAFSLRIAGAREGYSFTLGSGSAVIELESYNGSIHLVRPRT